MRDHPGRTLGGSEISECYSFNSQSLLNHIRELMILKWQCLFMERGDLPLTGKNKWKEMMFAIHHRALCHPQWRTSWAIEPRWLNGMQSIAINLESVTTDKYEVSTSFFIVLLLWCWLNSRALGPWDKRKVLFVISGKRLCGRAAEPLISRSFLTNSSPA